MTDARIAPVEDNLFAFLAEASNSGVLGRDARDDVVALRSDVPFPMFNAVVGARFRGDTAARSAELADSYLAAGVPWMWWTTPSTTPDGLLAVLEARGLEREDVPGMYADLASMPVTPTVPGLTVERTQDSRGFIDVMLEGFGLPGLLRDPMVAVMEVFAEAVNLLAVLDGRPVACGTAYLTGTTAGLYNIATLEDARGRGVGYAVTTALMQAARAAGATHAVLHATEAGRPVYERAGFVAVCDVPQYVWMPTENGPN